jgi:hypothetical protein
MSVFVATIMLGFCYFFLPFFAMLGLELRAYTLSHSTSPFFVVIFVVFFQDRVL